MKSEVNLYNLAGIFLSKEQSSSKEDKKEEASKIVSISPNISLYDKEDVEKIKKSEVLKEEERLPGKKKIKKIEKKKNKKKK